MEHTQVVQNTQSSPDTHAINIVSGLFQTQSGSASDGLAKSLANASQSVAIGENLRINNKKDKLFFKRKIK